MVRSWVKNDDGPACNLARKLLKQWENSHFFKSSSQNSQPNKYSGSKSNGHSNGRKINRVAALKSPSLSPSSESENEVENTGNRSSVLLNYSTSKDYSASCTKGFLANRERSISISSSSSEDDESGETDELNSSEKNTLPIVPVSSEKSDSRQITFSQLKSSEETYQKTDNPTKPQEADETDLQTRAENSDFKIDFSKFQNVNASDTGARYSPGNPTFDDDLDSESSAEMPSLNIQEIPSREIESTPKENTECFPETKVSPQVLHSEVETRNSPLILQPVVEIKKSPPIVVERSSQKEKLLDLKRRAALICNIPELASSPPKKKKRDKKEKKSKEKKSKKKSSKKNKLSKTEFSSEKHKRKSSSKTRDTSLEYDSLSGEDSDNSKD